MKSNWYQVGKDMFARDLWVTVPLDWEKSTGETIRVYAREIVDQTQLRRDAEPFPALLFLQGGPGGKSPRPLSRDPMLEAALPKFRVVLLDQRGTGRSTPVRGEDFIGLSPSDGAQRLSHYRADSIIRDCEALRTEHFNDNKWWTLGQSYGGFLTLHYLSMAPEAITASMITGGLPSLDPDPVAVYENTFPRVRAKNKHFFERFPHLRDRVDRIADVLETQNVRLPDGDRLTVRRFQTLGLDFGMEVGFDRVHWLLDEAFIDEEEKILSETFLNEVAAITGFATNPLFMVLQESIYGPGPSAWAADRERARHPEFHESARPLLFTGEMAFAWMAEEIRALREFGPSWKHLVAHSWPIQMYDHERLSHNEVPVEAVVYNDDMYVHTPFSLDTESRVKNLRVWLTNEFEHDGIRMGNTVERLISNLERRIALCEGNNDEC